MCKSLGGFMDSGTFTALAAIAGSASGALGSLAGAWVKERYHDRRDLLYREITRREALALGMSPRTISRRIEEGSCLYRIGAHTSFPI